MPILLPILSKYLEFDLFSHDKYFTFQTNLIILFLLFISYIQIFMYLCT